MLETRPQVERSSAKPGRSLCSCPSDCFPAPSTCSATSARCAAPAPSAPTQRATQPAGLELGQFVARQVGHSVGSEVGKPGGWVIEALSPRVCALTNISQWLLTYDSERSLTYGHGHASQPRKWCGRLGIEQRTARNALNVRASRCYQSEQRMHLATAAGPGAPGQRRIATPPTGGSNRPMPRTDRQEGA
jgi:hypothetical protein